MTVFYLLEIIRRFSSPPLVLLLIRQSKVKFPEKLVSSSITLLPIQSSNYQVLVFENLTSGGIWKVFSFYYDPAVIFNCSPGWSS